MTMTSYVRTRPGPLLRLRERERGREEVGERERVGWRRKIIEKGKGKERGVLFQKKDIIDVKGKKIRKETERETERE